MMGALSLSLQSQKKLLLLDNCARNREGSALTLDLGHRRKTENSMRNSLELDELVSQEPNFSSTVGADDTSQTSQIASSRVGGAVHGASQLFREACLRLKQYSIIEILPSLQVSHLWRS